VPAPEWSDGARVEALRGEADRAFAARDFQRALVALRQGFELSRDPRFLFNLGVTYHALGDCGLARDYYQQYLRADPNGASRSDALAALEALQPICGPTKPEPSLTQPPSPRASAPGAPLPSEPLRPPADQSHAVAATPRVQPHRAAAETPGDGGSGHRLVAWSLISVGGVGLLASGISATLWSHERAEYSDLLRGAERGGATWDLCCAARGRQLNSLEQRYRDVTIVAAIGSAVALVTGIALLTSAPDVSLATGPRGYASVSYGGSF
jgi:tetratricopeptide (TPR) repeat protein